METLQPLRYRDLKRELPPNRPLDRADLAIEIGFLIADGFLAVNSGNLEDVASSAVTAIHTPQRAKTLMREDIADYYEYSIASLHPKISERQNFVKMRRILTRLRDEMTTDLDAEPGKDRVAAIRKSSTNLVKLALERQR